MSAEIRTRRMLTDQLADVDLGPAFDEALDRLADLARALARNFHAVLVDRRS